MVWDNGREIKVEEVVTEDQYLLERYILFITVGFQIVGVIGRKIRKKEISGYPLRYHH